MKFFFGNYYFFGVPTLFVFDKSQIDLCFKEVKKFGIQQKNIFQMQVSGIFY